MTTKTHIRIGDYFYTSWGYDQTNIDYCIVISVSPTGKTALCRMVSPIHVGTQGYEDALMPGTADGAAFRMGIVQHCDRVCLRGSYPYIWNRPSEKRLDTFLPTSLSETHGQTQSQFGH